MKSPKILSVLLLFALLIGVGVPLARAMRPLYAPFAVVAGSQYTAGYQDGPFDQALFNQPLGLTASADGTRLFVADSLNHRIRVIQLDRNNEVGTVAGQGAPGNLDGPLTVARFHEPRGVLYLPGDRLVVNDFGNRSLRFVDLQAGTVTTYRSGSTKDPKATPGNGPPPSALLDGVKDMAYLPAAHSILFTQPEAGVLKALDLGTGKLTVVLKDNVQIPHPSALWVQDERIYLADRDLLSVQSMDWKDQGVTNMRPAGTPLEKVISLCSNDKMLYGLLKKDGYPVERFLVDKRYSEPATCMTCQSDILSNDLVKFNNGWGDFIPADKYIGEGIQPNSPWVGLVPDPSGQRRFFYSIPNLNIIVSLRDLYWKSGYNSVGLLAAEYPPQKPKNTFRILLCGSCLTTDTDAYLFPTDSHPMVHPTQMPFFPTNLSIGPQIEHELNFQAAMADNPMNYELLNFGRHGDIFFWPTKEVPEEVKRMDIDLVVILFPTLDLPAFYYYYLYNLTPDGVPQYPPDPEFALKPPMDRISPGLPRKFFDYCQAHQLVKIEGNKFAWDVGIYKDPQAQDMLQEFWGKPWDILNRKLSNMRTSGGKPVKLAVLLGVQGPQSQENSRPSPQALLEIGEKFHIPCYNLNPYMNALHLSYFPMTGVGHLDPNGAVFFGKFLTQFLKNEDLIPWPASERTDPK